MTDDLPRAAAAVVTAGRSHGLELDVREFPEGTRTAADAARAVGCQVDQIVKSLVFVADTDPVLVLTSGGHRVDVVKVGKERSAAIVRKADAEEVRAATGYAIGGTPPFGHARELAVLIDRDLTGFDVVWAAAGTPRHVFPIGPGDLVRATGGQVADVTLEEDGPPAG
ncbi:MAG TPA: YbaK/EbsC family protein [Actinomycetota bacterium]|nr:YbaK/EbsC family protein [Actinomycetota bacterium]